MRTFGLVGYPLGHSFSKGYFSNKFSDNNIRDCIYENFPIESISQLPEIIKSNRSLVGLNITIPYKEAVIPYLDYLSDAASAIKAVNTIKIVRNGDKVRLEGYNTDVIGFEKSLIKYEVTVPPKVLILGTGGASKAVKWVIEKSNTNIFFGALDRMDDKHLSYEQISKLGLQEFKLIINATPLGTYPDIESKPILPYDTLQPGTVLFDLVYNPPQTAFLSEGIIRNCKTINGHFMLTQQAEESWNIWNE